MLMVIEAQEDVARLEQEFQRRMRELLPRRVQHSFGHRHAGFEAEVWTDGDLWYHYRLAGERGRHRHWHAYGLFGSSDVSDSGIVVEINFPTHGVDRRIGGVLARSAGEGRVFVLHRGRIGGGRPGVSKESFVPWYARKRGDRMVEFRDGGARLGRVILIGRLDDATFGERLREFVHDVAAFKGSAAATGTART